MTVFSPAIKYFLLSILSLVTVRELSAQHHYDVWYFGRNAGIDFRSGSPVALGDGRVNTLEGSSGICHPQTGSLLFYTDGVRVWDSTHNVMPNGDGLKGHNTSAQSALVLPIPGNAYMYFVFTAGAGFYHKGDDPNNGVRYSIVDMRLNSGLGDVTVKNETLIPRGDATEMLCATRHCNGRDFWVTAHRLDTNTFVSYLVTPDGISDSVESHVGSVLAGNAGGQTMGSFSPNGLLISTATPGDQKLELYHFDNLTGEISNHRLVADDINYYSPEFSPDNSRLYASSLAHGNDRDYLTQFDLTQATLEDITESRVELHEEPGTWDGGQLQLGPDNRIYVSYIGRSALGVITDPNALGVAANYEHDGFSLAGRSRTSHGLPNVVYIDSATASSSSALNVSDLHFGVVKCGMRILDTLIITNTGDAPALVEQVDGINTPFEVMSTIPELPTLISEGDTVRVVVAYNSTLGEHRKAFRVATNSFCATGTTGELMASTIDSRVVAEIPRDMTADVGDRVTVPVLITDRKDTEQLTELQFDVEYDPSIVLPDRTSLLLSDAQAGTALDAWTVEFDMPMAGTMRFTATAPKGVGLGPSDTLVRIPVRVYISATLESPLPLSFLTEENECLDLDASPGLISIDSICGQSYRLIEPGAGKTNFESIYSAPGSKHVRARFTVSLDGRVRLYVHGVGGRQVSTLVDRVQSGGEYDAAFDVSHLSSGVYFLTLETESGARITRKLLLD